ncbi:unnamed protein product [Blepharisma stoltei]|uniref:EF-hand domain-containing protein n=1 Tax=Blepharisma stoltei TaxID=1481888 RepID=A0AAU9J2J7_9CILI|nr:unnamed protein product [Blepharisma stoltei]
MEVLPHYKENIRFELASRKLEEDFFRWLSIPSTSSLIQKLIEESKNPSSANNQPSPLFPNRAAPSSPSVTSPKGRASLTPPLSPGAADRPPTSHSQSLPADGLAQIKPKKVQEPVPVVKPQIKPSIPQFYFPQGKPSDPSQSEKDTKLINQYFIRDSLKIQEFEAITKEFCGLPKIVLPTLFTNIAGEGREIVTKAQFLKYWKSELEGKNPVQRLFNVLCKPGRRYLIRNDFKPLMIYLMETHPGLEFLKATPEFQERYAECVVERIFYSLDTNDEGKITFRELKRSKLMAVLLNLDTEEDINKIRDFFSYEHFYVLYCRFWELDTDHDFLIDKEDFSRYEGHTLSRKAIDRIFEEVPRKFKSNVAGKMSYDDFIWFMISEEDKSTSRSLEYWFKVVDLDDNGIITAYEMDYFYEEQLHRLEYLKQEAVPFQDVLCQLADMINPKTQNQFTLSEIIAKKSISGVFFNCLVNLNKFIAYEQRDPFQIKNELNENPDFTDWDRFANAEYVRLAMEEENAEASEVLDEVWDSDRED